jgi:hypothetical protein
MVWIGLVWLRIGTSGGLLWTRKCTFGFHKMLGSSWVAAQLAAPQEGFSSVSDWVSRLCWIWFPPALTLVSCSTYYSTLKMEAMCSSETSVDFQRTTRCSIPDDSTLQAGYKLWFRFTFLRIESRGELLWYYLIFTYISGEHTHLHIQDQRVGKTEPNRLLLLTWLACPSTLKMEAVRSSETSVNYQTTCHTPQCSRRRNDLNGALLRVVIVI